jgi:hypothetical protein
MPHAHLQHLLNLCDPCPVLPCHPTPEHTHTHTHLQGRNLEYDGLPVNSALSMGVHESQSLLWERMVGLGRPFASYLLPLVRETFPQVRARAGAGGVGRRGRPGSALAVAAADAMASRPGPPGRAPLAVRPLPRAGLCRPAQLAGRHPGLPDARGRPRVCRSRRTKLGRICTGRSTSCGTRP